MTLYLGSATAMLSPIELTRSNVRNVARTTSATASASSNSVDTGDSSKHAIPIAAFALLFTIPALIILAIIIAFWYGARSSSRSRIAIIKTKEEQKKFVLKSLPVSMTWGEILKLRDIATSSHQPVCTPIVQGDDVCAVCLEELKDADIVQRLPHCHHVFHRECCEKWIDSELQHRAVTLTLYGTSSLDSDPELLTKYQLKCPLCRTRLSEESSAELSAMEPAHIADAANMV